MKRGEAIRALLPLSRQVLENFERLHAPRGRVRSLAEIYQVVRAHSDVLRELRANLGMSMKALNRLRRAVLEQDSAGMRLNWKRVLWIRNQKQK